MCGRRELPVGGPVTENRKRELEASLRKVKPELERFLMVIQDEALLWQFLEEDEPDRKKHRWLIEQIDGEVTAVGRIKSWLSSIWNGPRDTAGCRTQNEEKWVDAHPVAVLAIQCWNLISAFEAAEERKRLALEAKAFAAFAAGSVQKADGGVRFREFL